MLIKSIRYIGFLRPDVSCGTGYSEPDKFHVVYDTGLETDVWVDIWNLPEECVRSAFLEDCMMLFIRYPIILMKHLKCISKQ
jgi:hypothetical protein